MEMQAATGLPVFFMVQPRSQNQFLANKIKWRILLAPFLVLSALIKALAFLFLQQKS
jgi:hypothetical protein